MFSGKFLYKVFTENEWNERKLNLNEIAGSDFDNESGYIHLSTEEQYKKTIEKRFTNEKNIKILKLDYLSIKEHIKWEPNSKNELFPHLYLNTIPGSSVV